MKRQIRQAILTAFSLLPFTCCLAGCENSKWSLLRNQKESARLPSDAPTAANLVGYLNQNAQRLQTLECRELDLDIKQKMQSWGLRGKMVCQQVPARPDAGPVHPANFRMIAESLGNRVVDLGSNEQEFWYWISKSDPPYLFHCSYQDMAKGGVRMPFPFQPEWVMEALGMAPSGPVDQFTVVPGQRGTLELVQQTVNSQGQPVKKVTVFNRQSAKVQVPAHMLRDARGREICAAYIQDVQVIQGATVPRKVVLRWPSEGLELTMRLEEVTINRALDPEQATGLFSRPAMANVQTYDLARGLDAAAGGLRPAGGFGR
jgi:hypothetical protein